MTIFSSKPPPSSAHNWENWIILAERIFHEKLNTEHLKSELTYIIVQIIYHDGRFFQTQLHATYNFHKQSMSCRNLIFILSVFWKNVIFSDNQKSGNACSWMGETLTCGVLSGETTAKPYIFEKIVISRCDWSIITDSGNVIKLTWPPYVYL